ncbi:DUF6912 family protein [Actinokineospora baliensis]|uniref:DUF6912 family protein n=1 Tax=Actinokineospora baliensis TaxID=547056 RepID=UPI00195659DE|nr:hypothetical protein [Actinokineospora baliensis]
MRVYIPATVAMLRELNADGELVAITGTAFALTPALRESYATGGDEELEYAAMLDAAKASLRLLGAELTSDPDTPMRRAVIAADVDGAQLRPDLDHSVVKLAGPVPMKVVASVHLDTEEAVVAVRAAVAAVDAADMGDPDAEFVLGDAEDHELAWYAPQELPFLLELL